MPFHQDPPNASRSPPRRHAGTPPESGSNAPIRLIGLEYPLRTAAALDTLLAAHDMEAASLWPGPTFGWRRPFKSRLRCGNRDARDRDARNRAFGRSRLGRVGRGSPDGPSTYRKARVRGGAVRANCHLPIRSERPQAQYRWFWQNGNFLARVIPSEDRGPSNPPH